jgi:hypothetical protein
MTLKVKYAQDGNFLDCPEEAWDEPTLEKALVNASNGSLDSSHDPKVVLIIFKHGITLTSISSLWEDVTGLFDRIYFTRLWVVQEVALAQSLLVYWDSCAIQWELIAWPQQLFEITSIEYKV